MIISFQKIKKNLINSESSILDAIKKINKVELKFLLIINKSNSLIGTITDGDLRRAIVEQIDMKKKIIIIMNKKFIFLKKKIDNNMGQLILNKKIIKFLPILDSNNGIRSIIIPDDLFNKQVKKNKILFIAGGKGKRLMPLTKNIPKPLLKIKKNSIIHELIMNAIFQGFKNFLISVNYKAKKFKQIFEDGKDLNCKISYLTESKSMGTAGPITFLKKKDFNNKPMIVMNADLVTNINFSELLDFHNKNKNDLTVCIKNISINIPYGEIEFGRKGISKISEKPYKSYFVNIGIYVISSKILKVFKKGYLDMNDFINVAIKRKMKVKPFAVYENWQDIGNKLDFNRLKNKF